MIAMWIQSAFVLVVVAFMSTPAVAAYATVNIGVRNAGEGSFSRAGLRRWRRRI